jgi:IclR family transcriptional regulator, acetate operon repressor
VSLRRRGLVERDGKGRYRPGSALLALGLGVLDREPLVAAARPCLETASETLGETFFVVAARGGKLTVLDKVEGTGFVRAAPRLGSKIPVEHTAVGKLYRALAPGALAEEERARARSDGLERELVAVRKLGYAENLGEWTRGMFVLAAAVVAHGSMLGAVAAALSAAHAERLDRKLVARVVVDAAQRVAARMEGKAP